MTPRQRGWLTLFSVVAVALGSWVFQFLCDDAYIEFRYVRNAVEGFGFVWNRPPFQTVEGYTSFLWVALLAATWSLTGVGPETSALVWSLLFSVGTVGMVVGAAVRVPLAPAWEPHRLAVAWAVLVSTLTNRAFLAFTSSGLETPLWTFTFVGWAYVAVFTAAPPVAVAAIAAVAALVRPDGLLLVGCTGLWIGWRALAERRPDALLGCLPFGIVLLHLVWRYQTYGYWLPNTYYAKHVAPWPVMGAVYLTSFVWEFAYWPQVALLLAAGWVTVRGRRWPDPRRPETLVLTTAGLHWAYYTFNVGGDHFEYRVYHHLVPLLALLSPVLAGYVGGRVRSWGLAFAAAWGLGLVVPWAHWSRTWDWAATHTETKDRKGAFILPIRRTAWPVYPYAWVWDELQFTLNARFVGLRWHCHDTFIEYQRDRWWMKEDPPDLRGDLGVLAHTSIGWPGWIYPEWAIIDMHGLNDVTVARTPTKNTTQWTRIMAHDRNAKPAYVRCYRPNFRLTDEGVVYEPRSIPLSPEQIRTCETKFLPQDERSPPAVR